MDTENLFITVVGAVVLTFLLGAGALIWHDQKAAHEAQLACIAAGKTVLRDNCVKLAP